MYWPPRNRATIVYPVLLAGIARILLLSCLSIVEPGGASASTSTAADIASSRPAVSPTPPSRNDVPLRGRALRRLTVDGSSIPRAWGPDGQSLLLRRPGRTVAGQQLFELWVITLADGRERRLADNAIRPAVEGRQVAYLRYAERGRWEAVVAALADGRPITAWPARWNVPPLWVEGDLIYLRPTGQWPTRGDSDRSPPLAALPGPYTRARLSSDGQRLAATDGRRLWALGAREPHLVDRADQIWGFAWSPTSARLVYVRSDGGPRPELWLWDAETGRSVRLARAELEHWSTPAWAPDGVTLAFVRRPTGNGGNAPGDIWLVRVPEKDGPEAQPEIRSHPEGRLFPFAETSVDESAPTWSPDGRKLAFAMEGDTWVADLDAPDLQAELSAAAAALPLDALRPAEPAAPLGLTAPLTIRVMHDGARNTCRDVPDGQIDALPFEQYVKQVVPNEMPALWPMEAVKSQAVAARTYGWRKTLDRPYPAYPYAVRDSTADQYMCDRTHSRSDAAVDATRGQYVGWAGKVIYAFYCAEAGDPTNYRMLFPTVPYLRSVNDPVGFGRVRRGHSWGMSQWGAYRWALRHGWDYQQILGQYYTSAGVEPSSAVTGPLVALALPWSDHYVTTDHALLLARAAAPDSSPGAGALTVTLSVRLTETWTSVYTDAHASDGWQYVWPVGSLSDTVTPSIGLQAAAYGSAGQVAESGVTLVGLNRAPPTGTLAPSPSLTSTDVTTLAVPLALTATDPSPDRGPILVSLGSGDWRWEDRAMSWTVGELVADAGAGDGSAWHVDAGAVGTLSYTGTENLSSGQAYRAHYRLKAPTEALTDAEELARLAVLVDADGGAELLGVRYVRGTDVKAGDVYQEFAVDFPDIPADGDLVWQVRPFGETDLWVDRITASSYPLEAIPTFTWTLPPREGPATITARFVDGAGNTSPAVSLAVTVTDRDPPGGWRRFRCSGWTCTVQVRDAIAGLHQGSAAVRFSGDKGQSWTAWVPASCTGQEGSHDWETLTVPVAGSPAAARERQIQFRAYDRAATPNEGRSPVYVRAWAYLPLVLQETR